MYDLTENDMEAIARITSKYEGSMDSFPFLSFLAEKVFCKPVTVYDVETASFLGTPNFGITEVAMVHIIPGKGIYTMTTLCDPCNPISKAASEVTSITNDMVKGAPRWEDLGGPLFHHLTREGHIFIGFNNFTFDRRCIVEANKRRGFDGLTPSEEQELDTFKAATMFMGKPPKLGVVAAALGIVPEGRLHRALADVIITAGVADKLGQEYGLSSLKRKSQKQRTGPDQANSGQASGNVVDFQGKYDSSTSGELDGLLEGLRSFLASASSPVSVSDMEAYVRKNCHDKKIARGPSFFIGESIDYGRIKLTSLGFDEEKVCEAMTILSGDKGIIEAWSTTANDRKLKPLFDIVKPFINNFDYIMLREALTRLGVRWATLKVDLEDLLDAGNQHTAHRYPFLRTEDNEDTALSRISL
jgi:DNA polymerase III epsilon subunit-like protein